MPEPRVPLPLVVTIGAVLVPMVVSFAVLNYAVSQFKEDMRLMESRLTGEIQRVDLNSANRRNESHSELVRLHEIQGSQIKDNRDDLRELQRQLGD